MTIDLSGKLPGASIPPFFNAPGKQVPYVTGHYYPPVSFIPDPYTGGMGAGRLSFVPFIPKETYTFKGIASWQDDAGDSGGLIRMGIYTSDSDGAPDSLIVDGGEIVLPASTGLRISVISEELIKNTLYYLTIGSDISYDTLRVETAALIKQPVLPMRGIRAIDITTTGPYGYYFDLSVYSYGPLPATASAFETTTGPAIVFLEG